MNFNEEKAETVDIESFTGTNDLFEQEYGVATMANARENQERLERMVRTTKPSPKKQKAVKAVDRGLKVGTNARLSYFDKEKVYANEWTESVLDLVESTYLECQKSSEAHADAARACRKKHRMVSIPTVILATAATSASFFQAGTSCGDDSTDSDNLKYTVACLTSLVAILGGVSALYSFNTKMNDNINAAGSFANLARRAKIQIFLPNHLRAHSEVVLTDISAEQAHLVMSSPLL